IFAALLMVTPWLMPHPAQASAFLTDNQQAYQAFQAHQYQQAAKQFTDPQWQGIARYKAGDYKGAIESLSQVKQPDEHSRYNLANAYAQNGQLSKAEQLYQQVLKHNPNNQQAQKNLQIVKRAQQKQKQQQQQQHNNKQAGSKQKNSQSQSKNDSNKGQRQQPQQSSSASSQHNNNNDQKSAQQQKNAQNRSSKSASSAQKSPHDSSASAQPKPKPSGESGQKHNTPSSPSSDERKASAQRKKTERKQQEPSQQAAAQRATDKQGQQRAQVAANGATQHVDPALRKLDQVEGARDPSELLRAQLYLQSKLQPQPDTQAKKW
ncbi:MAG: tetratricopeptide repeat protein, partial [Vibrio sp.]